MAFDKFTLERSAIWLGTKTESGETFAHAAFAFPSEALDYITGELTLTPSAGWYITIAGQTVRADAFVTRKHAFEWVSALSIYGTWAAAEAARERIEAREAAEQLAKHDALYARAVKDLAAFLRTAKDWQEGEDWLANHGIYRPWIEANAGGDEIAFCQELIRQAEDQLGEELPY